MATATVTVTSPAAGYHRITVTGPTNGSVTTIPEIYTAIQALADVPSRGAMSLINGNTYSVNYITALSVTGTYTQFYINNNVRVQLPTTSALVFSQSSTATSNIGMYLGATAQLTCSAGSVMNFMANNTGGRYTYFVGGILFQGQQNARIRIYGNNITHMYCLLPSNVRYTDFIDNTLYSLYFNYSGPDSLAYIGFNNIKIYNVNQAITVGTGIVTAAGSALFNNINISDFQIYSKSAGIVLNGGAMKFKNGLIREINGTAVSITAGGNVVNPPFETSMDDTRYPIGMFQSMVVLDNVTMSNYGKLNSTTLQYGVLANYNSLVYMKNCSIVKTDGIQLSYRRPLSAQRRSIVIQHGQGTTFSGHTLYGRNWLTDGTFLRSYEVDITVTDNNMNPISYSTITLKQNSTIPKQSWCGLTNDNGKLVNIYGDNPILISKQQTSEGVYQNWSDGSSSGLNHYIQAYYPGLNPYTEVFNLTENKTFNIMLTPQQQVLDTPGIEIGQGIIL